MASLNSSTSILGVRKAKHLLRRSCFQYSKAVLDQFAMLTPEQALAQLTVEPTVFWEDPYDMKVNSQPEYPMTFGFIPLTQYPQIFLLDSFENEE